MYYPMIAVTLQTNNATLHSEGKENKKYTYQQFKKLEYVTT